MNERNKNNDKNKGKNKNSTRTEEMDSKYGKKATNTRGRRNASSRRQNDSKGVKNDKVTTSRLNDPGMYSLNEQMLKDSASLAYGVPLGTVHDLDLHGVVPSGSTGLQLPGICTISVDLTLGASVNAASALNLSTFGLYSWVRHANSGHANYDAPDLMLYIGAMDSIHACLAWFKRLYGVANLYHVYNRYYPRSIVEAMGVDFDDLIEKLPTLRYFINNMCAKLGSMAVPAGMRLMQRHQWLFEGIYLDGPLAKAQTYLFNPHSFLVFKENTGPGELSHLAVRHWVAKEDGIQPIETFMTAFEEMVNAVITSEDMNIMSGDLLKAYGLGGIIKVVGIESTYTVLPSSLDEVLSQINNLVVMPAIQSGDKLVTQTEDGKLISKLTFRTRDFNYDHKRFVNLYKDEVQPADTMVATRLMLIPTAVTEEADGTFTYQFDEFGTEVVHQMTISHLDLKGSLVTVDIETDRIANTDNAFAILGMVALMSNFSMHPIVYSYNGSEDNPLFTVGNIMNFTEISDVALNKMHMTAVYSELEVPKVGSAG